MAPFSWSVHVGFSVCIHTMYDCLYCCLQEKREQWFQMKKGLMMTILALLSLGTLCGLSLANSPIILKYVGPTAEDLNSVFMVDANNGWIVGDFGTILNWNGTE